MNETDLLHVFIERAPLTLRDVRIFRRNIINRVLQEGDRKYALRNGIAGQCDAYAVMRGGLHVELEAKAAKGRTREAQIRWRSFCEAWRIPYLVIRARADETTDQTVTRWIDELRAVVESKAA